MRQQPPTILAPASTHARAAPAQSPGVTVPNQALSTTLYVSPDFGYAATTFSGTVTLILRINSGTNCGGVQLTPTATTVG
jgi:hypothetical protein